MTTSNFPYTSGGLYAQAVCMDIVLQWNYIGGDPCFSDIPSGTDDPTTGATGCTTFPYFYVGWQDGYVTASWKYNGANTDAALGNPHAFQLFWPDRGASYGYTTIQLYAFQADAAVSGAPGWYFARGPASTQPASARIFAGVPTTVGGTCAVNVHYGVAVPGESTGLAGGGSATDPNTGSDCGAWYHLKCHFMAALSAMFKPTAALDQWHTLASTASSHPPISLLLTGFTWLSDAWSAIAHPPGGCMAPSTETLCLPWAGQFQGPGTTSLGGSTGTVDLLRQAGNVMQGTSWGSDLWELLRVSIWAGALWRMYGMLRSSFGGKH
jgi:hypothetical protein